MTPPSGDRPEDTPGAPEATPFPSGQDASPPLANPETPQTDTDRTAGAARRSAERAQMARDAPEPSVGSRLGQIGILGWAIVTPILLGVVLGRLADRTFDTGVFFTAPAIFIGAAIGLHAAWKWMHQQ
ncbi:AtpZ/AtpI family protein [Maritimibacter alkaliphilus]|uniref:AtpZ/AtpI family protein n=1 Tax=Maritimibacter alkaliphilus TaxID=404236 RepID=UPI0021BDA2CC|nr:AtpZ/AtpI family protein [Maritimibacter alkaliphilus]